MPSNGIVVEQLFAFHGCLQLAADRTVGEGVTQGFQSKKVNSRDNVRKQNMFNILGDQSTAKYAITMNRG